MAYNRGIALIMSFLVIMVIAILAASLFSGVINENRLVRRFADSTRAFWLAEAGIAEGIENMPGDIAGHTHCMQLDCTYSHNVDTEPLSGYYYQINSSGSAHNITRSLRAIVWTQPVPPSHFQHAIRTTSNLVVKGSVEINGPSEEFASIIFADLFEHSKADIESYATHVYTNPPNDVTPITEITWVNLSPGNELRINSDTWTGNGILVVEGDAQITGGTFNGIIYVIGKLRMTGNPVINGTILAESATTIDTTLTGNVEINYDINAITAALSYLQFIAPAIVSWQEI